MLYKDYFSRSSVDVEKGGVFYRSDSNAIPMLTNDLKIEFQSGPADHQTAPHHSQAHADHINFLFFNLTLLNRTWQFFICVNGVFVFFLLYGYFQELIFQLDGFKPFGWYLTLIQFACYTVFAWSELQLKVDKHRRIPFKNYLFIAFLTVATMGLSNSSLAYLNYPTQVIFKCCKLIPVLLGGVIIQGKRYGLLDLLACLCMSIGLILFTLADNEISPNFNPLGIVMISLALVADAIIGNMQEKNMKVHGSSNVEMVLYSYSIGFIYIFCGVTFSGELFDAFKFCIQHPVETYGYAFMFSITGYLGVNIVLTLVKSFGALVAVTVTTCRKALSIVISFLFFTKPFTLQYVWSGLIIVLGIYLNIYSKNNKKWNVFIKQKILLIVACFVGIVRKSRRQGHLTSNIV